MQVDGLEAALREHLAKGRSKITGSPPVEGV
jgi:hypothetical protein